MDPTIAAGIIGAAATILGAYLGAVLGRRQGYRVGARAGFQQGAQAGLPRFLDVQEKTLKRAIGVLEKEGADKVYGSAMAVIDNAKNGRQIGGAAGASEIPHCHSERSEESACCEDDGQGRGKQIPRRQGALGLGMTRLER